MRILLVEDDAALASGLVAELGRAGYAVDHAADGTDGQHLGDEEEYDLIILDLGLPGKNGLDVLTHWRERGKDWPVLILTARDSWHEKVAGFRAGADDYLTKPFHPEELKVRAEALLRRSLGRSDARLAVNGLTLDQERQLAILEDGREVSLSGMEFRLLRYLMLHPGHVLSKTQLAEHVYAYNDERDSNVIEVYIRHLRKKLGEDLIETRRGQGYIFLAGDS